MAGFKKAEHDFIDAHFRRADARPGFGEKRYTAIGGRISIIKDQAGRTGAPDDSGDGGKVDDNPLAGCFQVRQGGIKYPAFGPQGGLPNWTDPKAKRLACLIHEDAGGALFLMFNAGVDVVDFCLPILPQGSWRLAVDTSREAPGDLFTPGEEPFCQDPNSYRLGARSSAILLVR